LAKIKKKSPINMGNVCNMSKIPNTRTFLPWRVNNRVQDHRDCHTDGKEDDDLFVGVSL
jgi:hypothetical protein